MFYKSDAKMSQSEGFADYAEEGRNLTNIYSLIDYFYIHTLHFTIIYYSLIINRKCCESKAKSTDDYKNRRPLELIIYNALCIFAET